MDINSFGFFTTTIPESEMTAQMMCDFALKCYNLFLLYFYFSVMKFVVTIVQRCIRRFTKLSRGF